MIRDGLAYVGLFAIGVTLTIVFSVALVWAGCGKDVAR